jgi:hypothetical protein
VTIDSVSLSDDNWVRGKCLLSLLVLHDDDDDVVVVDDDDDDGLLDILGHGAECREGDTYRLAARGTACACGSAHCP